MQKETQTPHYLNLITSLTTTIKSIFNLNDSNNHNTENLQLCFKTLIFDDDSFNILSPMLKIYTLREHYICFYMNIKDKRNRVQDIMAIYIIKPTKENFELIMNDLDNNIFDNYSINFIDYNTDDKPLTDFYENIAQSPNYNLIYNINICPIDFCVFHPRVFSLDISRPFLLLNSPNVSEEKTNRYFDDVSDGLFSMLFTLKMIPIVKYRSKSYPVEEVIKRLQNKYNKAFEKYPELKEEFSNTKTSLVIILDRETDIPIMLHHATSFGAMINDIASISRTSVKSSSTNTQFQVDPINDYIWNDNINEPFDQIASIILKDYKKYHESMSYLDKISKPKGINEIKEVNEKLSESIESLKDNQIINNILKQHKTVYDAINKEQQKRMFGLINEHESLILAKRRSMIVEAKNSLLKLIRSYETNSDESMLDLYRMIIIYYLCNQSITLNEENELETILREKCNQNNQLIKYIKGKNSKKASAGSSHSSFFQSGINYVVNSIGSLLTIEQPSIMADLINLLAINKDILGFNTYNFYKKAMETDYKDVIIFAIGGGCLGEFEYIDGILKKNVKNLIYGCDQLYRQVDFMNDLITLSKL